MSLGQLQGSGFTHSGRINGLGCALCQGLRRVVLGAPSRVKRDSLLLDAAVAIRCRSPEEALRRLRPYLNVLTRDPAFLNMMGAAHEAAGRFDYAHELYRLALISNAHYDPARRNLDRLGAWDGDPATRRPASLGDLELRSHRAVKTVRDISRDTTPKKSSEIHSHAGSCGPRSGSTGPGVAARARAPAPTRFIIITRHT